MASPRRSPTVSVHNTTDIFDDEFAEEDPFVIDGRRRPTIASSRNSSVVGVSRASARVARSYSSTISTSERIQHHGSLYRRTGPRDTNPPDPFASPYDDTDAVSLQPTPSTHSDVATSDAAILRGPSMSRASSFSMGDTQEGDFRGISGPSHPYAMYSQGVSLGRTPSVATTSTLRASSRTSSTLQNPGHPYRLYAQNVFADPGERPSHGIRMPPPAGVGFQGRGQTYHRRFGPDGEEQDIIGPDGHTEQLPPYSRYPDEGGYKAPLPETGAPVTGPEAPTSAVEEQASVEELLLPASAHFGPRPVPEEPPGTSGTSTSGTMSSLSSGGIEKTNWSEKSWRERRKSKRFWLSLLGASLVILIAVILGGVIGGLLVSDHSADKRPTATKTVTTSLYDASIIPTPASFTSVPTGSGFALPLQTIANQTRNGCLVNQSQGAAWACNVPGPPLTFSLNYNLSSPPSASVFGGPQIFSPISYGTQPPTIPLSDLVFATDLDARGMGPALYLRTTYDKIVIVSASAMAQASRLGRAVKRDDPDDNYVPANTFGFQRRPVDVGDRPWFCYWNQTFIEAWIYVNRPNRNATSSASNLSITSSFTPTSRGTTLSTSIISNSPNPTVANSSSIPSPSESWAPYWTAPGQFNPDTTHFPSLSHVPRAAAPQPSIPVASVAPNSGNDATCYPRVVKIEERRIPGYNVVPYCQQMQILTDGGYNPALNSAGGPVPPITLQEIDPTLGGDGGSDESFGKVKRDEPDNDCHCQWVSV